MQNVKKMLRTLLAITIGIIAILCISCISMLIAFILYYISTNISICLNFILNAALCIYAVLAAYCIGDYIIELYEYNR